MLDLLIELGAHQAGISPQGGTTYSITEKVRLAGSGSLSLPPLTLDPAVWRALATVYVRTEDVRHSLVHRKADVDSAGSIVGTDRAGNPIAPVTASEQESFSRMAQRGALVVLAQSMTSREREDLGGHLDRLVALHRQPLFGYTPAGTIELVSTEADRDASGVWDPGRSTGGRTG